MMKRLPKSETETNFENGTYESRHLEKTTDLNDLEVDEPLAKFQIISTKKAQNIEKSHKITSTFSKNST